SLISLEKKNQALERFAYIAAHDLRSPLANISGLTDLFIDGHSQKVDEEGKEIINLIKTSSDTLKEMIDNLLEFSKSNIIEKENNTTISVALLIDEISALFAFQNNCTITFKANVDLLKSNKSAIEQILINLISNAIKYNDKENIEIEINIEEHTKQYVISVGDNGPGILEKHQVVIFEIFEVIAPVDRFGAKGNGIGLATVKKLVEALGGAISVQSQFGQGAKFTFTMAR
ncbi:HAMP domain-containing sensor histidine kinase, partial [Flavobacterium sp.]|uniref:sensor histidine kinase n=1 Tax=Flavobacterium sp. TaxID=239 RepID=UPI00261E77F5